MGPFEDGASANLISYNSAISACGKGSWVAGDVKGEISDEHVEPATMNLPIFVVVDNYNHAYNILYDGEQ